MTAADVREDLPAEIYYRIFDALGAARGDFARKFKPDVARPARKFAVGISQPRSRA